MTEVNRKADNDGGNVEAGARRSTRRSERAPKLPAGSSSPRCHVVDTFRNRYILVEQLECTAATTPTTALFASLVSFSVLLSQRPEKGSVFRSLSLALFVSHSLVSHLLTHSLTLSLSLSVSLPGMRVGGAGKKVVSRKIGKRMLLTLLPFCLSDGLRGYPV